MDSHTAVAVLGMDSELVEAVLADWESAQVDERIRAALRLIEVMTLRPQEIDSRLIDEIQTKGLTVFEIEELAAVAFHFNFINRAADAINFPIPNEKQVARQAKVLNQVAKFASGGKPLTPSWSRGHDEQFRPTELCLARTQLLNHSGAIDSQLRQSIEGFAASLWNAKRPRYELPHVVEDFVRPLSLHAYRIHDELVTNLTDAGYSNRQIFEMTLLGSFGAAIASLERLFCTLYQNE